MTARNARFYYYNISIGETAHAAVGECRGYADVYPGSQPTDPLECFDDQMDSDALLDRLLEEDLAAEMRRASVDALSRELDGIRDRPGQQAYRWMLLRAARIARSRDRIAVSDDLTELAMKEASWLVTPSALEASGPLDVPVSVTVQDGPPVDHVIQAQLDELSIPTGPDLETKYRFTDLTRETDALAVALAPTTWTSATKFHTAVLRDPAWTSRLPDGRWVTPIPFGDRLLPGIAVVHAIVMTSDDKVIAAQRSARMSYAPSHWSVSFEEQLNEKDIGHDEDAFIAAARRGFHEEFGVEMNVRDIVTLTTVMQTDLLNLGMVMLLRPLVTAEQIRDSWMSVAKDGWEAQEVLGIPLDGLSARIERLGRLHPTSELRGLAVRRWLLAQREGPGMP
jgi:hypothetical protein